MVISSSVELAIEFQLCFVDEFQLCVGRLVLALCMSFSFVSARVMWPWVGFYGFGIVLLLLTIYSM